MTSRIRRVVLVVVCVIALLNIATAASVITGAPAAHAAPLSPCNTYWVDNDAYGFWDAEYQVDGQTSCNGSAPQGYGDLFPCSNVQVSVNMDVWLAQSTVRGGTRLADSGRTGIQTWVADCRWHTQATVIGWGQVFTTPLWACLWADDYTVNLTFNYLCVQDY